MIGGDCAGGGAATSITACRRLDWNFHRCRWLDWNFHRCRWLDWNFHQRRFVSPGRPVGLQKLSVQLVRLLGSSCLRIHRSQHIDHDWCGLGLNVKEIIEQPAHVRGHVSYGK
ncbi:Hypp6650 [Branchiostoma lanceolatum]|uniref:Hypp6650 protein n=1 Tax=Branchiostoma lanceolatum TaxID=7740 RepID=A0A8J9YV77_BRALA|nr:Hypp6650 [Branchiostoma lanceolatum]